LGQITFTQYDEANILLLSLLEPILMNEHNANMFRHIDGMAPLANLILAQRLPADKLGGKTGNQIGPDGKIME